MTPTYYPGLRPDLTAFLNVEGANVLDVGCGAGGLAHMLRERGAKKVVGVEASDLAKEARLVCDEVHHGTVEEVLPHLDEHFDFVVVADVLEHLVDPWAVLRELQQHVTANGTVLVSIPNVSHFSVLAQLILRRDWRFDSSGIFDRTHLRWFGRRSLEQMIDQAGFVPIAWAANASIPLRGRCWERTVGPAKARWLPSFVVLQWIVVCRAVDAPNQ